MNYSKGKKILFMILVIPVVLVLFVLIVMYLWNWLIPTLFGGPIVTFWQALGLLILSKILFGGFKGGRSHGYNRSHWGNGWKQKFKEMSPEDRVAFKAKWGSKWGCCTSKDEDFQRVEKAE
jgi:hypothetical protein